MFNTVLVGAAVTAFISVFAVMHINDQLNRWEPNGAAYVEYHAETLNGLLKNNADAMCPAIPDRAEYAEVRQAAQCERFGY